MPKKTNAIDWVSVADSYVASLERECAADHKKFWKQDDGSARAQGDIAAHEGFIRRLHKFVRAN